MRQQARDPGVKPVSQFLEEIRPSLLVLRRFINQTHSAQQPTLSQLAAGMNNPPIRSFSVLFWNTPGQKIRFVFLKHVPTAWNVAAREEFDADRIHLSVCQVVA